MKKLSLRLLVTLILFAIILITVMSLTTRYILVNDIVSQQLELRNDIENNILTDLDTMDRAHLIFQQNETDAMEKGLRALRDYYERNPDIYSWDSAAIKERYNMDFYLLNEQGQVVLTTHKPSENVDFNDCCTDFVKLIQERIQTDEFYFDGLEISVAANDQRMYSYLATADHKYLLEFGIQFAETRVAKEFNFEDTITSLLSSYNDLEDLRVLTYNGFILNNEPDLKTYEDFDEELQAAFLATSTTGESTEVVKNLDKGYKVTHRFIPYQAEEASGTITKRIVYAQYSNTSELQLIEKSTTQFIIMLGVSIITALLLVLVILKIFNSTIRLATFDTLTGAYNRASYLHHMDELIHHRKHYPIGLMLIDLDNFKMVNDVYGHAEGDIVLRATAEILKKTVGSEGYVVRFGGDEFAVVFEAATEEKLRHYAKKLLDEMHSRRDTPTDPYWTVLSMSIGCTLQHESREQESHLFERADKALYMSKDKGKDTYTYLPPDATT